jgi:hypothetical protein
MTQPVVPKAPRPSAEGTARGMSRTPVHVAVAVGATTGLYALTLLGVTRLQVENDRALIAARAPAVRAIELLGGHHDLMTAELEAARAAYAEGAESLTAVAQSLPGVANGLDRLDATLAAIEAELRQMPGSINIPKAPPRTGKPGSGSAGGGGGGGGTAAIPVAPKPPAAAPPPVQGTTGGSGAP